MVLQWYGNPLNSCTSSPLQIRSLLRDAASPTLFETAVISRCCDAASPASFERAVIGRCRLEIVESHPSSKFLHGYFEWLPSVDSAILLSTSTSSAIRYVGSHRNKILSRAHSKKLVFLHFRCASEQEGHPGEGAEVQHPIEQPDPGTLYPPSPFCNLQCYVGPSAFPLDLKLENGEQKLLSFRSCHIKRKYCNQIHSVVSSCTLCELLISLCWWTTYLDRLSSCEFGQFLPQDRVCEFAKLTPIQLLEETEKAVGDPELSAQHQTLIERNEEMKKIQVVRDPYIRCRFCAQSCMWLLGFLTHSKRYFQPVTGSFES